MLKTISTNLRSIKHISPQIPCMKMEDPQCQSQMCQVMSRNLTRDLSWTRRKTSRIESRDIHDSFSASESTTKIRKGSSYFLITNLLSLIFLENYWYQKYFQCLLILNEKLTHFYCVVLIIVKPNVLQHLLTHSGFHFRAVRNLKTIFRQIFPVSCAK